MGYMGNGMGMGGGMNNGMGGMGSMGNNMNGGMGMGGGMNNGMGMGMGQGMGGLDIGLGGNSQKVQTGSYNNGVKRPNDNKAPDL